MPLSFPLRRSSSCRLSCSTLSTADCSSACFSWNRLLTCSISAAGWSEKEQSHQLISYRREGLTFSMERKALGWEGTYTGCHWWLCCSPLDLSLRESSWASPPGSPRVPSASAASRSRRRLAADDAPAASGNANAAPTQNKHQHFVGNHTKF